MVLGGVTLASLVALTPALLSGARRASARALVAAHERASVIDATREPGVTVGGRAGAPDPEAALAVDGRDDTGWSGKPGELRWTWAIAFARKVHLGLVRARLGTSTISGVPTAFHWEVQGPVDATCSALPSGTEEGWTRLAGAEQRLRDAGDLLAQPTRRSWFVDADACALRLVVDRTNAGPPVLREVQAIESAQSVLRDGEASDDGAYPGFVAADAIDGTYERRWSGAPDKTRWTFQVTLPRRETIDRVHLVLGLDARSAPRPGSGRRYVVTWAPVHYTLEASEDGRSFVPIATAPTRADGSVLPLRRRLVTLAQPRAITALRLVMVGATGPSGLPEPGAVPVLREIAAYRADDRRPILGAPWVLSVNANPSAQSHVLPGGEVVNDAFWAGFLQRRFAPLIPSMRDDDRFDRRLDSRGDPVDGLLHDAGGEALEAIEGDDPELDAHLLSSMSPPPMVVLSGSNDWDYAATTAPDEREPRRWHWDPLRDARAGGIGQLAPAVRSRVAPFLGFCGGAQLLGLLEAGTDVAESNDDQSTIDGVLRRTSGRPIRGFAPAVDIERSWPADAHPTRAKVQFQHADPLFTDIAGATGRSSTQALPVLHSDALRRDAFRPGGPLERFELLATSSFCRADITPPSPHDGLFGDPTSDGPCQTVTQAFRSRDRAWPVIGAQFHAEQRDFTTPASGDPPESVADPRLFVAGAYEQIVDAYLRLAP